MKGRGMAKRKKRSGAERGVSKPKARKLVAADKARRLREELARGTLGTRS